MYSEPKRGRGTAKRRKRPKEEYNLEHGDYDEEGYGNHDGGDGYHYVYHESAYDDTFWWICFGVIAFFFFIFFIAIIANYHSHPDDACCDDDEPAPLVRETRRGIDEDPTGKKENEAFKILKDSQKTKKKANGGRSPPSPQEEKCPGGTSRSTSSTYALIDTGKCSPNYNSPVAVDDTIVKGYNPKTGKYTIGGNRTAQCTSFASFACSGWEGLGGRSFTYSTLTNNKVLGMVENLDAIGDHLHWDPETGVIHKKESDESKEEEQPRETIASEREVFSSYIQNCHSSLDEIPSEVSAIPHQNLITNMLHVANGLEDDTDWEKLGEMYGVAACMGVNPLFHMRTETDLFDNSEPLFYFQPKGFVGLETNIRRRALYIKDACAHIGEYMKNDGQQIPRSFANTCTSTVLNLEKRLGNILQAAIDQDKRNSKDDAFSRYITDLSMDSSSSDSRKDADKRRLASESSKFFSGEFFQAFMNKLVLCATGDITEEIDPEDMYVWTEYKQYFDEVSNMIDTDDVKSEKETFDMLKTMVLVSLSVDNLEVVGYFAAGDYDHVSNGGKASNKGKYKRVSPEHGFLSGGFTPYIMNEDISPRIIRLNGDRKHAHIRKSNLERVGKQSDYQTESFIVSKTDDWANYAWFTCIDIAQTYFPEIVDNSFASFTTTVEDRAKVAKLIDSLLNSLVSDMQSSSMLDTKTKNVLTEKAEHILKRIGVPWDTNIDAEEEELRKREGITRYPVPVDHGEIGLKGLDFYEDTVLIRRWAIRQEVKDYLDRMNTNGEIKRFGVNSLHFGMKTSETNAYYSPLENNINILSGIMKPPFFHGGYSQPSLYATMGSIIGHELSHSLDKTGVLFDKYGNLNISMLAPKARAQYEDREECFVNQYKKYKTSLGNVVDSENTLSENIADNAGCQAAYDAMRKSVTQERDAVTTPEELVDIAKEFTLAYAQLWCTNRGADEERYIMSIDVHSPPQIRIDRTLSNLIDKETGRYVMDIAWGCEENDRMVQKPRCAVF